MLPSDLVCHFIDSDHGQAPHGVRCLGVCLRSEGEPRSRHEEAAMIDRTDAARMAWCWARVAVRCFADSRRCCAHAAPRSICTPRPDVFRRVRRNRDRPLLVVTDPLAGLRRAASIATLYRELRTMLWNRIAIDQAQSLRKSSRVWAASATASIPSCQAQYHGPSRRHQAAKSVLY